MLSRLIKQSDPIHITGREGMKYGNIFLEIGRRAGPSEEDSNAVHELAHFIEMEDNRIGQDRWGMKIKQGDYIPEYRTFVNSEFTTIKHLERECRVWAIQYILESELFDIPVTVEELAESSPYLPDLWFLIGDDKKIKTHTIKLIKENIKKYSLAGIKKEYDKKIVLLEKYFSSNT